MTCFSASRTSSAFSFGNDHVVDADGDAGAGGVEEAELLHLIEHLDGGLQAELQIAVLNQLRETLLLEKTVDEGHVLRQNVVQDDAADGGVHVLLDVLDRLGADDVLAVERLGQIDDACRYSAA